MQSLLLRLRKNKSFQFLAIASLPWLGLLLASGNVVISGNALLAVAIMSLLMPMLFVVLRRQHDLAPALTGALFMASAAGGIALQSSALIDAQLDALERQQEQAARPQMPKEG